MSDGVQIPVFLAGVRLEGGSDGQGWRLWVAGEEIHPNDIAGEILRLVNGARSIDILVDLLALRFTAPRERIAADVVAVLDDLVARGAIRLREPPQWKLTLSMLGTWLKLLVRRGGRG